MGMIHLFVKLVHHHRLDHRQQFGHDNGWDTEGMPEGQRG